MGDRYLVRVKNEPDGEIRRPTLGQPWHWTRADGQLEMFDGKLKIGQVIGEIAERLGDASRDVSASPA